MCFINLSYFNLLNMKLNPLYHSSLLKGLCHKMLTFVFPMIPTHLGPIFTFWIIFAYYFDLEICTCKIFCGVIDSSVTFSPGRFIWHWGVLNDIRKIYMTPGSLVWNQGVLYDTREIYMTPGRFLWHRGVFMTPGSFYDTGESE